MCVGEVFLPKTTAQGGMNSWSMAGHAWRMHVLRLQPNGCEGEDGPCFGDIAEVLGRHNLPFLCSAPG